MAAQEEQPPASSFVTCVSMEQGCTACLGEDIVCPSTMSTGDTAPATESTAMATKEASTSDPKPTGENYRNADRPKDNAGLGGILGALGDTRVKDLTPSEVSIVSAIMSQTCELSKMLTTDTSQPTASKAAASQVRQQDATPKTGGAASALPSGLPSTTVTTSN